MNVTAPIAEYERIHTKELRYIVERLEPLRRLVLAHAAPIEYVPGQPESLLTTVYLDTPEGTWSRGRSPVKFRCRTYQHPSLWWFELKRRIMSVVDKWRRPVAAPDLPDFINGRRRWARVERYTHRQPLIPLFGTRYFRTAFEWPGGLRLTLDRNVLYYTVDRRPPYRLISPIGGIEGYVVEVKSESAMPRWLADALAECHIDDFSKSKRALEALRERI